MKFNWGTGIIIALALFMAFIVQFAVRMIGEKVELVADDYYHQEVHYQQRIDQISAAKKLGKLEVAQGKEEIVLRFPKGTSLAGKIVLYKPDNSHLDRSYDFEANTENGYEITLSRTQLVAGRYTLKVEAQSGESQYYWEENLYLNN